MTARYRPLVQSGAARPAGAVQLAGGELWFTHAERLERGAAPVIVPTADVPGEDLARLTTPRAPLLGLDLANPHVMGIVNTTPDSFSDGGLNLAPENAVRMGRDMARAGASIVDIGGESTRPGAALVPQDVEIDRTAPVIAGLGLICEAPISIDTRKGCVAQAAHTAGAVMVNDVSGFTYDPGMASYCATHGLTVCIMHAQGTPDIMQDAPDYEDVLLDVYDALESRVNNLVLSGIPKARIAVDPGIGFGKTVAHNLTLLQNISLFHGLGCAVLLGVSRKGFIGKIGGAKDTQARAPGSIAVGLAALAQGVQILRVHDVEETMQAVKLWQAVRGRT